VEAEIKNVLKCLWKSPLLRKFAKWLYKSEYYGAEEIEALLCKTWDGAYPTEFLGDDLLITIGNFLYYTAEFTVERVYGENYWEPPTHIRIVADPSYEDRSYVYVLELNTKTILAVGCGRKTWNYNPEAVEDDLKDLAKELEETKGLLATRIVSSS